MAENELDKKEDRSKTNESVPAEPQKLFGLGPGYNMVWFMDKMFCVPHDLGPIELSNENDRNNEKIITSETKDPQKKRIYRAIMHSIILTLLGRRMPEGMLSLEESLKEINYLEKKGWVYIDLPEDSIKSYIYRDFIRSIPAVEIKPGLDFLLIELPARYQPLRPNGIGYVNNIIKDTGINLQTIDLNIIFYHRYHFQRIFEQWERITASNGYVMKEDPWEQGNVDDEWKLPEVIDFFWPQVEEVIEDIVKNHPKIIGLSSHANSRIWVNKFIKRIRELVPDIIIIVGGYDCLYQYIGQGNVPDFDYMIIRDAEISLKLLVKALLKKEKVKDLPGVISRYDSPDRVWQDSPFSEDLDAVDFPRYEWIDNTFYQTYNRVHLIPIITTMGCVWSKCRFCGEAFCYRIRSPKNVVDELEFFTSQGWHSFHLNDSDCNGDPQHLYDICSEIMRRGLKVKITGQMRISRWSTKEYFEHLAKAGFRHVRFGVDGWSVNTLKLQLKGYTMSMVHQNLSDCCNAGIIVAVNVVLGVPGETEDDVDEIIKNLILCKDYITIVESINTLIMTCGSEYYLHPEKYNIRFRGDKEKIYKENSLYIPTHLWYSESPYIDQDVRKKRLEKIVNIIYDSGVRVGTFAQSIVRVRLNEECKV
ncbi:B12-binding domain-containing radical SAM protein [bacterium]